MGAMDHEVMATLLLSVFWFVLIIGVFLVFLIVHWKSRRTAARLPEYAEKQPSADTSLNLRHSTLKRPNCWLAIKSKNLLTVQYALSLHNPKPCSWAEGLSGDGEQKIFVSPPVSGWILVIGSALPEPGDDVDACFRFLVDLSRKLGQVQFFSANTMLNHHAWAQVESGHVLRAYAWTGKTLWNQGKMSQAETDLGLKCYDYAEIPEVSPFGSAAEGSTNNADKVHFLAARWSIDPEDIDERFIEQEWGIVGEPSKHF
ncbi:MAG: hypothetical protein JWR69_1321 [Pedosphaera sp.]|nr:hypothetical protein [Pedosphaera sp.]